MHWWVGPTLYNDNATVSHWALVRGVKLDQKHRLPPSAAFHMSFISFCLCIHKKTHDKSCQCLKRENVVKDQQGDCWWELSWFCVKRIPTTLGWVNLTYLDNICDSQQKHIGCVSSTFLSLFSIISVCVSTTVIEKHKNVKENKQKSATECNSNTDVSGF